MSVLKYSRQRESIKENLQCRTDHPTADMIYADIREIYPNISLGTIYRNLSLLTELGEIRKLPSENGADRFDANTAPHNHFVCRKCGEVYDIPASDHQQLMADASREFDGEIEGCEVTFYGVCGRCIQRS